MSIIFYVLFIFILGLLKTFWNSQIQIVRYKNKINITKPRPLHFERDIVERICVPYFFREKKKPLNIPSYELCNIKLKKLAKVEAPIEGILGKEVLNKFNHSKLIAIFHKNYLEDEEKFESEVMLKNNGLKLLTYDKSIMKKALTGTIYEPILKFYQSRTVVIIGEDPDIYNLLKVIKKTPKLLLLGAVVNNRRLLNFEEIENYGKEQNLESARQTFLSTLNILSVNLIHDLTYIPNSIIHYFDHHKKLNF